MEEFITGREFGAQAFVMDGKEQFVLPHGDYIFRGSTGVPAGHFAPYALSEEGERDCIETTEKAIRAMKLDNCAVNCDFIMRDGRTYVLEIGEDRARPVWQNLFPSTMAMIITGRSSRLRWDRSRISRQTRRFRTRPSF